MGILRLTRRIAATALLLAAVFMVRVDESRRREPLAENTPQRLASEFGGSISVYDDIFRAVAAEVGFDWRLIGAIAYHESRFSPEIVSRGGAVGMMQIMPVVCRHFNVDQERLLDPMTNVRLAGWLMAEIERSLALPAGLADEERTGIVLAGYNCGVGHVSDARRLARAAGENPDSWRVVVRYLELKSLPEYYRRPEVRSGRFDSGRRTLAYVSDVMSRYRQYCRLIPDEIVVAEAAEEE